MATTGLQQNPPPTPPQLEGVGVAEATELGTNPIQLPGCIPGGSCSSLAAPKDNGDAIPEQGSEGQLASQEHRGLLKQDSSLRPGSNSKTPYPAETQASPCLTPTPAHKQPMLKASALQFPSSGATFTVAIKASRCWRLNKSVLAQPQMPATVHPQHGFWEPTVIKVTSPTHSSDCLT